MNYRNLTQYIKIYDCNNIKMRHLIIACCSMAILVLFGTYNSIFTIFAFMVGMWICIQSSSQFGICLLFFLLPLATIFKLSPNQTSLFTFLEIIWVLCAFYKRRLKATTKDLLVFFFTIYLIICQIFNGGISITVTAKLTFGLLMVLMIEKIKLHKNYANIFLSYVGGIIISSFMKFADSSVFRISSYIETKTERLVGADANDRVSRFSGLYGDPNYYSVNLIIAIILILILYEKRKLTLLQTIMLVVPLIIFIAMTGSKSAFLMLTIPTILFVYVNLKNRHYIVALIAVLVIIFAIQMILNGRISIFSVAIERLISNNSNINDLTSGRGELWVNFIIYICAHLSVLLFGRSVLHVLLNNMAPHNTYIDFVYQLGLVGTIWLFIILIAVWKNITLSRNKKNIMNYSVLGSIIILYFFLSEFQYIDFPFHIILCLVVAGMEFRKEGLVSDKQVEISGA